ncbi:hypothetical protein AAC387_Pa10g1432 [Persea americana]
MAEFSENLKSFKSSLPFLDMYSSNIEYINQFTELNATAMENTNYNLPSLMGFSNDNFLTQQSEFTASLNENFASLHASDCLTSAPIAQSIASMEDVDQERKKKRKAMTTSESSSGVTSTPVSESGSGENDKRKRKNSSGRGKKGRSEEKQDDKLKEVIHVRARRGQATDSHSLAERVRREKINERMRCLQELVPGCYKTMGMAVMLDEIINYVQSLQNQVEFLSMKLSAASSFYDFSVDMETTQTPQVTNPYEVFDVERLLREGYGVTSFHPSLPL